jgi:hypothetical protein
MRVLNVILSYNCFFWQPKHCGFTDKDQLTTEDDFIRVLKQNVISKRIVTLQVYRKITDEVQKRNIDSGEKSDGKNIWVNTGPLTYFFLLSVPHFSVWFSKYSP